jgi:lipopolysaccharide/colanic/teichoic acid biosynthesis glycosyltransferase
VNQGYAAGVQETRLKLEYDLYYVKYLSLWLDGLIIAKTIKTIMTGFGSR